MTVSLFGWTLLARLSLCYLVIYVQDDSEPVWVDTVGWDDAECEDDETFKDILRFIDKYNITKVRIWD